MGVVGGRVRPLATVVGGGGFIGSALSRHLQTLGWTCWLPDRQTPWPVKDRSLGHVFYCAGLTVDFAQRPADTIEAHTSLVSRVLQSTDYQSLVYLSSTRLYDGLASGQLALESSPLTISPTEPRHLYDLSKLTGEAACLALGKGKARVARLSSVYCDHRDPDGFLPRLLATVMEAPRGATVEINSSPFIARDYVHLEDVVTALVNIAARGTRFTYNVASGCNVRNDELARLIENGVERHVKFSSSSKPPPAALVDISAMRTEFDWRPRLFPQAFDTWAELHELAVETNDGNR